MKPARSMPLPDDSLRRGDVAASHNPLAKWTGLAIVLLLLTLTVGRSMYEPLGMYDEGFAMTNAWRLLQGDVPHRDYWAAYPPGSAGVLATAFALGGAKLAVARWVDALWSCILLLAAWRFMRDLRRPLLAPLLLALIAAWLWASMPPGYSATPGLAIILLALTTLKAALRQRAIQLAALAGVLGGVLVLFRHDFFGYLAVSCCLALAAMSLQRRRTRVRAPETRILAVFLATMAIVGGLGLLALVSWVGWAAFLEQAVWFPATGMRAHRALPVPGLFEFMDVWIGKWLMAWTVPIGMVLIVVFEVLVPRHFDAVRLSMLIIAMMLCGFLTLQGWNRLDLAHVAPSMMMFAALLHLRAPNSAGQSVRAARAIALEGLFLAAFTLAAVLPIRGDLQFQHYIGCLHETAGANCLAVRSDRQAAADYLRRQAKPTDYVFVGNTRHDTVLANDAALYFLIQRPIPVPWNEMHPGIVTTLEVQQHIVRSLEEKPVKWVVTVDMPNNHEPNLGSVSSGVDLLDRYVASQYTVVFTSGRYQVALRKH